MDDVASSAEPRTAQQVLSDMEERMRNATERFIIMSESDDISVKPARIHRFPHHLRGIGGADGRYVVPSVVSIGPYHHGLPHLQAMEEVKHVAALQLCLDLGCSVQEVYGKILSVAGHARICYDSYATAYDASRAASRLGDAEFAAMMFMDGCFLLKFMMNDKPPVLGHGLSSWPIIVKDMLLLENQIPWLVLEALVEFMPLDIVSLWIDVVTSVYFFEKKETNNNIPLWIMWLKKPLQIFQVKWRRRVPENRSIYGGESSSKPPHLLGLLRLSMTSGMPSDLREGRCTHNILLRLSSSAVYLSQIGVRLTASTAPWFPDVKVEKRPVLGELSLSPLFLNDIVASILVNMVALEVGEATNACSDETDGFVVSSYLSLLGMLMDREEDVQELRGRGLLCSHFSNTQTLAFFKVLVQHLRLGFNYFAVVQEIEEYIRKRPVRISVHRFLYNNSKLIAAVLSIAGVLVGIFKTLYSVKQA